MASKSARKPTPDADVLRFRVSGPKTTGADLPLEDAIHLLAAPNALLAVAHSLLKPQRYHPRMTRSRRRLGQSLPADSRRPPPNRRNRLGAARCGIERIPLARAGIVRSSNRHPLSPLDRANRDRRPRGPVERPRRAGRRTTDAQCQSLQRPPRNAAFGRRSRRLDRH